MTRSTKWIRFLGADICYIGGLIGGAVGGSWGIVIALSIFTVGYALVVYGD